MRCGDASTERLSARFLDRADISACAWASVNARALLLLLQLRRHAPARTFSAILKELKLRCRTVAVLRDAEYDARVDGVIDEAVRCMRVDPQARLTKHLRPQRIVRP